MLFAACCISFILSVSCLDTPVAMNGYALIDAYSDDKCSSYLGTTRYDRSHVNDRQCQETSDAEVSVYGEHSYSGAYCGNSFANITIVVGIRFPVQDVATMGILVPSMRHPYLKWRPTCEQDDFSTTTTTSLNISDPLGNKCEMYKSDRMDAQLSHVVCQISMVKTNECITLKGWGDLVEPATVKTQSVRVRCSTDLDKPALSVAHLTMTLDEHQQPESSSSVRRGMHWFTNMLPVVLLNLSFM
jgi:hypothetical protein